MKTKQIWSMVAAALLATAMLPAAQAQALGEPVVGVADPDALFTDKDPKLHKNKQAAYHIVKELLECNQWKDAGNWLTDKYIQHNPMAASGLKGVIDFFTNTLKRPATNPCPAKLQKTKVVAVLAQGDYVTVVFPREYDGPGKPGMKYTTTWFDMWRFVDGKADEHWDPATLAAAPAPASAAAPAKPAAK
jgi:predicted SnoaL-like aldol condensation-catalyzing enzyme